MPLDHPTARRATRPPRRTRPVRRAGPIVAAVSAVVAVAGLFISGIAAESLGHREKSAAGTVTAPPQLSRPGPAAPPRSRPGPAPARPAGIGHPVRDGRFEFVVTQADCSPTAVGLEQLNRTADGRYCVVTVSVRNIGRKPQFFLGKSQKAIDLTGAEHTNDEFAGLWANRFTPTFLRKIDPGRRVVGKLVFDVPEDTTLTAMELHDAPFSGGVRVALK
jgi:Domain of unknown function (DUF4352)